MFKIRKQNNVALVDPKCLAINSLHDLAVSPLKKMRCPVLADTAEKMVNF